MHQLKRLSATGALAVVLAATVPAASGQGTQAPARAVGGATFSAVQVHDVEVMAGWYRRTLGLDEVSRLEADDGRYSIRILSGGGLGVELIQLHGTARPDGITQGLFKAGFFVTDIDAFHGRLLDPGVEADATVFTDEPLGARSIAFRDAEGDRLQAFQRTTSYD